MSWLAWIPGLWRGRRGASGQIVAPIAANGRESVAESQVEAFFEAGHAAYHTGDYDAAVGHFNAVLELRHDHAKAHYYSGLCHLEQNRHEDAADCFLMATHFRPDFPEAVYNLGLDARRRRDYSGAAEYFEQAVGLNPNFFQAHNNLGYMLSNELEEYERGDRHIEIAMRLRPHDPNILCNYSALLLHRGQPEQALELCSQLLASHPGLHEVRLNRALALLKLGHFSQAWRDYESRKLAQGNYIPRDFGFPEWDGESLRGKSILVYAEQGIGDQVMFASCLPDLLLHAGRCIVECSPRLKQLFRRSFPTAMVCGSDQASRNPGWLSQLGAIDFQMAIGSLPRYFRTNISDFPRHHGYLAADPARVAYWRQRLQKLGSGLKIGLSWRGGAASTRRALRSIPLHEWLPLLKQESCRFVSLQYGGVQEELAAFANHHALDIHHWQEAIDDYDETAALVCALDLVVSVQTAVVHLCGALGRPAWVMVPAVPEWRYLQRGEVMPWYPTIRLLRRGATESWQPVIERAAANLARLRSEQRC